MYMKYKECLLIKMKIIEVNIYSKIERIFLRCSSIHLLSVLCTIFVLASCVILLHFLLLLLTLNPRNIHIVPVNEAFCPSFKLHFHMLSFHHTLIGPVAK